MMMTLFDEEQIMKNHDAAIRREEREKVTKKEKEQAILSLIFMCKKNEWFNVRCNRNCCYKLWLF